MKTKKYKTSKGLRLSLSLVLAALFMVLIVAWPYLKNPKTTSPLTILPALRTPTPGPKYKPEELYRIEDIGGGVKVITTTVPEKDELAEDFSVQVPNGWSHEENFLDYYAFTITITKGDNSLIIKRQEGHSENCAYPDYIPTIDIYGPDTPITNFVELKTPLGTLRRSTENQTQFRFCSLTEEGQFAGNFLSHTKIGNIYYLTPKTYNEATLTEMDNIVKSIVITE